MKDQIFPQSSLGRLVFFVIAWKSTIIILKFFIFCCRFYDSSVGKESSCNAGDPTLISGLGRSPGERKGYPLQYSGLENSMNCIVHRIAKSWTWLSEFHFHYLWTVTVLAHNCFFRDLANPWPVFTGFSVITLCLLLCFHRYFNWSSVASASRHYFKLYSNLALFVLYISSNQ